MKINREARQSAKKLYRACLQDGRLDQDKLKKIITAVAQKKPRNCMAILVRLKKLVEIEISKSSVHIESAEVLSDQGAAVLASVATKFGPALKSSYKANPELIGGMTIQRGSDVWDGSVRGRLKVLEQNLN